MNKTMKVDLVMWTRNGAKTLAPVLNRLNYVIPSESVGQRLIVDDASDDTTVWIAETHGWKVLANEGSGISDGANTALKHVETEYFASFEQDVVLSWGWWTNIVPLLKEKDVVVASGVRLPQSSPLLKIGECSLEKARGLGFPYFKTLDNTVYKTSVIQKLGGFPKVGAGMIVDTVLAKQIWDAGLKWLVDGDVVSTHLKGVWGEVKSQYFYGWKGAKTRFWRDACRTLFSPLRGIEVAWKKKCLRVMVVYPLLRVAHFIGVLRGFL